MRGQMFGETQCAVVMYEAVEEKTAFPGRHGGGSGHEIVLEGS